MRRYIILAAAVIMQLCLGATYSWSIYVGPIREISGLGQGATQLPFTLFYFAFPAMMVITGSWLLPRIGPRRSAVLGGLLFGSGWLLAGLGSYSFLWTIIGVGLLAGIGSGMSYIIPVTVGMGWFPKNKGLVTGVAVAGFGSGAALVSLLGNRLMGSLGFSPFLALSILGLIFIILIPLAGSVMAYAPGQDVLDDGGTRLFSLMGDVRFRVLYLAMFAGLAAGFGFNANIREIFTGPESFAGVLAVSLFALANGLGRIIWGGIADRWKVSTSIRVNLAFQCLVLIGVIFFSSSASGFLLLSFLAGFNYGGVLVLYAAGVEKVWGSKQVAGIYSALFSANIPAALAPVFFGFSYDRLGDFNLPLILLSGLLLIIAVLFRSIQKLE